jgi:hypothetical protein
MAYSMPQDKERSVTFENGLQIVEQRIAQIALHNAQKRIQSFTDTSYNEYKPISDSFETHTNIIKMQTNLSTPGMSIPIVIMLFHGRKSEKCAGFLEDARLSVLQTAMGLEDENDNFYSEQES